MAVTSQAALFSRLQLAAALLEYDNDPDNPDVPFRSAKDSAIFAHLRRNPAARPDVGPRKSDYLGPSEAGSLNGRESALDVRRSRASKASIDALRNPFHADVTSDGHEEEEGEEGEGEGEEGLEVDLASWGLDAFMPKDKKSAKAKGKQPATTPAVSSTRARLPSTNYEASLTAPRHGYITSKSISLGGDIEANEMLSMDEQQRRRSFGSPLDLVGMESSGAPFHSHHRAMSQASVTPASSQPVMVPFPSGGSIRAPSPGPEYAYGETGAHNRTYSSATMGSRFLLDDQRTETYDRQRTFSNDTQGIANPVEDNPFAIQNPSQFSRFDPKTASRVRSYSNATMGSRLMPENDAFSVVTGDTYTRERRFSTIELLRPKVLVMPSPLQPVSKATLAEPVTKIREGFEITTDGGPPLPPGARASRRLSTASLLEATNALIPSNSFTPTPFNDLTLSQKTFRSTLAVPGQTAAYSDLPTSLPRATEDGEQAVFVPTGRDEGAPIIPVADPNSKTARPAGKLYGKSLIDDLEMRKAQMRSKQRVFTGDQRPSMMARASSSSHRVSTLIDPATLNARPGNSRSSSYNGLSTSPGANLSRNPSQTLKPLITFDGDEEKGLAPPPNAARLQGARSVFGVDTLWQREMEKLNQMKAVEQKENEERKKREEEEEHRKEEKKNKRKKKGKGKDQEESLVVESETPASPRVSAEPPTLPNIQRASRRAPPKPTDSDFSSEESDDDDEVPANVDTQGSAVWHSSDEDEGPRRTTGVGLRYPKQIRMVSQPTRAEDSDSDLPLAATIQKARSKLLSAPGYGQDDSEDEDRPLSHIMKAKSVKAASSNPRKLLGPVADEDEDDEPLGIRASRIPKQMKGGDDEDDVPLAFHPEQQRKSQFQMLAAAHQQQQQQQQQMMMQAQFQSNMLMNSPMLTPSFYAAPPMMNPMAMMSMQMMPPMSVPSPPPIQDEVKYGMVDRWRKDVAVDGEPV